ncbi:YbhB/YbcL family Raf kinase inhibitor-like protein [bacterium]|nr:YbhB/YbcL family Raf kinase inhibitor-like protein [bacterium]
MILLASLTLIVGTITGCGSRTGTGEPSAPPLESPAVLRFEILSPAFADGETIPVAYTADGGDISPPLNWSTPPVGTVELALIVDDPDAPADKPCVHWIVYGIPVTRTRLEEGASGDLGMTREGINSFDNRGYDGPAPPKAHGPHRYVFTLYALDKAIDLPAGATKAQLLQAMDARILAKGQLTGTYGR